ncbi:MAG: alpha/beta hydrolase fold family protein [Burkholderiales bacterium]|nr:alpha/beta hydrolase fold family protein [Burkholderiales bacterium]
MVLVPGLWMPSIAMALFRARLAKAGYATHLFVYRGRDAMEANVSLLEKFILERLGGRAAHFAGHSLGGTLILDTLCRHRELRAASVLLLGAPVRGCLAGRRLARHGFGRWMLGQSAARWQACEARWPRPEPLGVVAGTLPLGLGRALGALPGENDGVVRVEETRVEGTTARALVREGHSMLIVSPRVMRLAMRFFEQGSFA